MTHHDTTRTTDLPVRPARNRAVAALGLAAMMATGLMLSACNTTAGMGRDVSATGAAVTRSANDVKSGL